MKLVSSVFNCVIQTKTVNSSVIVSLKLAILSLKKRNCCVKCRSLAQGIPSSAISDYAISLYLEFLSLGVHTIKNSKSYLRKQERAAETQKTSRPRNKICQS